MPPFKRVTYAQTIEKLKAEGLRDRVGCGPGGGGGAGRHRGRDGARSFVTNFPKECKAFYMKEDEDDPRTYKCADLLAPEGYGEIIGGSERETDLTKLMQRLEAQ